MLSTSFSEFPITNKNQWKQQVIQDLRGRNFDETLVWQSSEKIVIQPYYAEEDLAMLDLETIQAAQTRKNIGWQNRSLIKFLDVKTTNLLIINALQKGTNEILLDVSEVDIQQINWVKLLDKIKLSDTPIIFRVNNQSKELIEELQKFIGYQLKGGIQDDVLANWMKTGKLDKTWKNSINALKLTADSPKFTAISVESHHFHNAGATIVQELAFTVASAVAYLDKLTDAGYKAEEIINKIEFSISIGTNYFAEIAKIRALKYLWRQIVISYQLSATSYQQTTVNCQTSLFYDSVLSPYTNLLRATTESMSAVIGGCDSLTVHAYNACDTQATSDDFSARISRNISILMKEESNLDKTNDASAGSYFIENLTNDLANATWKLFLEIEEKGGIISAFETGFVQDEIEKSYQEKVALLKENKVMIGVNKFREENIISQIPENKPIKTDFKLLYDKRIAKEFE